MMTLLQRSEEFENALSEALGGEGFTLANGSARVLSCAAASVLSIEHASVIRVSFATAAPNTATALMRLQYEAILRAAWLLHSATDLQVDKCAADLNVENEQAAKNLPGAAGMLDSLIAKAPLSLVQPLQEFDAISRKTLNSFVHAGIHPLRRLAEGFPLVQAQQTLKCSNGLLHMSYRLMASLSGDSAIMERVTRTWSKFEDCIPAGRRA